jgi:multiple sugar transport system substrate-binding protein
VVRWSRRQYLAAVVGAAAVGTSGCGVLGSPARQAARPATAQPQVVLQLAAWAYAGEPLNVGAELLYQITEPFRRAHPGVEVRVLPALAGAWGSVVPAVIAGTAPDVLQDWDAGLWQYLNSELVLPLDGYVRRDNVDLGQFNARQLATYYDAKGALIALPAQTDPVATAVNLSLLDDLGLPYPEDGWTAEEAARLWRAVAGSVQGKRRYGGLIYRSSASSPDDFYLQGIGGSYVDPKDRTRTSVAAEPSLRALAWCLDLLTTNVCTWRGDPVQPLKTGQVACLADGSWNIPLQAVNWTGFKWRYFPMPRWPVRAATFCTTNFWAIPATCRQPDLAWELLRYVATSPEWQRGMMSIFLTIASIKPLLEEWQSRVLAVAPALADKNVGAFAQAVRNDEAYPTPPFARATAQAYALISQQWNLALGQKADLRTAMQQAAMQVDALEALASDRDRRAASLAKAFPTQGPEVAAVPAGV